MRMSGIPEQMRFFYQNGHSVLVEPGLTVHYHHYSPENYTYLHDHDHVSPHRHPVERLLEEAHFQQALLFRPDQPTFWPGIGEPWDR